MINIQSDSRKIKPGDTFIALRGIMSDGHSYIKKAIELGATKIIAEEGNYDVETLIVEDTRIYLNEYLKTNYNKYINTMKLIGITGTNGKTTSACLLHDALNMLNIKTAYIGTIGFYIDKKVCNLPNTTVDLCDMYDLLMNAYENNCKNVIMEVSSHGLFNGRVDTLDFDIAIFTNLTQDHLDFHNTMDNYAKAKQLLFKKVKKDGLCIINNDDKYKDYFLLNENHNITYGFNEADYQISDYNFTNLGTKFSYKNNNESHDIATSLIGKYNIYNTIIPIIILEYLNVEIDKIIPVVLELHSPEGRLDKIVYKNNSILIDYAHTSDAIEKVINTVKEISVGKIYVVFGCTGDRDRTKRPIMTKIVSELSDYFIITNDDPHYEETDQIVNDMLKDACFNNYEVCLDRKEAIIKGINLLKNNDVLLILGKGHEEEMIIKDKRIPFNDRKTVIKYLDEMHKTID